MHHKLHARGGGVTMAVAAQVRATRGRPSKQAVAEMELTARGHEAHLFTAALRTIVVRLEAVLLQPYVEVPPDALMLTAQLRAMGERYSRRWEPES